MSLFLSNPSKQDVVFHYRKPFPKPDNLLAHITIPSGGQVEIGQKWDAHQTEIVIDQLHTHGARDAAETHRKMTRFTGLLYRHMGQISEDEILMGHEQETKAREERSVQEAQRGALAFDRNANARGKGQRVAKVTDVEVKQEIAPHARPTGDEVHFSMSVDPEGRKDAIKNI